MTVSNILWTAFPHLLMLLKTDSTDLPDNSRHYQNMTHYPPLSTLGKYINTIVQ